MRNIEPPWVHGPSDDGEACDFPCQHNKCIEARGDWKCDSCDQPQEGDTEPFQDLAGCCLCADCWEDTDLP